MSSAWAVIENHGKILLVRRSLEVGRGGQWCPPGGTIWRNEMPEVAAVREAFEETGVRVHVVRMLAEFNGAYFILCRMNSDNQNVRLRERECIDHAWIDPKDILTLGTVMDLKRVIPVLRIAGMNGPTIPRGLELAIPSSAAE